MSDVNYVANWTEEATQCKNCVSFQSQNGKNACVPPGETFEAALMKFGEALPTGHCDYFTAK